MPSPEPGSRNRAVYGLMIVLVMGCGLLWRSRFISLPEFATKYGGDAMWALLVFFGFAFVFHRASTLRIGLFALVFAWAIEFSQIYHAEWIDQIRSMRIGALVLGSTFNPPDLLAYAAGVAIGVAFEWLRNATRSNSGRGPA